MSAPAEVVREVMTAESGTVALLNKSEIDQQIATAKKYPRSLKLFRDEALQMVTLTESIAKECVYALPRDGKVIEGPSARFAEVMVSAWGNSRAGARVVGESGEFVTAQGVFYDLERNVAITYEVQRRIVNSSGRRYKTDMIGVTANAACSIALRNAILKGIPKAFWSELYTAARRIIAGDVKTLANRRADAIKEFAIFGVNEQQILGLLGKAGVQDIGIEDLVTLHGTLTAIRDGDSTPEDIFGSPGIAMPQSTAQPTPAASVHGTQQSDADGAPTQVPAEKPKNTNVIGDGQKRLLAAALKSSGKTEAILLAHLGVTSIDAITMDKINEALAFAKSKP